MSVVAKLGAGALAAGGVAALIAKRAKGRVAAADPERAVAPQPTDAPEPLATRETPGTADVGDRIDLNSAGFEQLRSLDLSITQANRIIAIREQRGGFNSLEDLDAIGGLSVATRAELRRRLRL